MNTQVNPNEFGTAAGTACEGNDPRLSGSYAEMYLNDNSVATTIETADTPIMIRNFTVGQLSAYWTYHAGSTGAITAYADYSGTVAGTILVTDVAHGLSTGDIISIRGTAAPNDYNGVYSITWVSADTFYITAIWNADAGASDWDQGDYLLAGAGAAGLYAESWALGLSEGGAAGSTVLIRLYQNATFHVKCTSIRKFSTNDVGAMGGQSFLTVVEGDRLSLTIESSGVNAFTISWGNFSTHQI